MSEEDPQPLEVIPITGERMVFWVRSERAPTLKYRVDLLAHGGVGMCSCDGWRKRTWPKIRDGVLHPFHHRCDDKHVEAARNHMMMAALRDMAAKEQSPDAHHPNA